MAKRKTSKPRASSTKKSGKRSGGGIVVGLVGVIIILAVIVSYYYNKETPIKTADNRQSEINEPTRESQRSREESKETQKAPKPDQLPEEQLESKKINPQLPDYEEADDYYFINSFDFAWPAYDVNDVIVEHEGFTLNYDEKNEQASWVAYKLEKSNLDRARFKRKDNFREDPLVRTGSATLSDYKKSGFDRGHLAPAADFTWSEKALDQTFFMSNMSPQVPAFNRGIWRNLEEQVRDWTRENGMLYIVTGPIISDRKQRIGSNKVVVPKSYYKVVLDIQEPDLKAIAFVMKNEKSDEDLLDFAITIDRLEEITHLDFFPSLPDEMERKLESSINVPSWK